MRIFFLLLVICLALIFFINIVDAKAGGCYNFGVAGQYWEGNPLVLPPGGTSDFSMFLQNVICDNDLLIRVLPIKGDEYVEITDASYYPEYNTTYFVPESTIDVSHVTASLPLDSLIGDTYPLSFRFFSALPTNDTPVFYSHLVLNFDIKVIDNSSPKCPSDVNGDGIVNSIDLTILLVNWGDTYTITELLDLLANWGACDTVDSQIPSKIPREARITIRDFDADLFREVRREYGEIYGVR
jgi:hypothetical protein